MIIPVGDQMGPRKNPKFRKQNYWTTKTKQDPPPWYEWDHKLPISRRSFSETNLPVKNNPKVSNCETLEFKKDFREYLLTSTLHGLHYIGEKKLTWFERFFWLVAFTMSFTIALIFIMNIYDKWRQSPMIVSINPVNMPLSELPFPAITICNVNQAKKSVAARYKEAGDSVDTKLLESLCSEKDESDAELFEEEDDEGANWNYFRQFLINVTQPCGEMLAECTWNSKTMACSDLFNAQLTDEGLCCTFNAVHRDFMFRNPKNLNDMNITFPSTAVDWTPEGGYPPDSPPDGFPWRAKGVGTHHGLKLVLDANIAEYYCASTKSAGFKILLHNPTETPKIANLGEIYGPGVEARVAIQPRIYDAQPGLQGIDVKKRLCFFSSEKTLLFFRTYTIRNCEMECESRQMLDICKCVLYYMPTNERQCEECLASCTEISFDERMSSGPLLKPLVKEMANRTGRSTEYFVENMLVVHFYFEDGKFQRFTKGVIFGLTEFLSNTGGLLGLCMGFSMMSLIELLYYCTLRAFCKARHRRPKPFTK
ncbi:amiloride-sensitive sodium channel domain-containing protein [Phthorimaea operculella]|nr:amiloride-sensitive sodium channel domain-containing protein [Phthorimaea operculella]